MFPISSVLSIYNGSYVHLESLSSVFRTLVELMLVLRADGQGSHSPEDPEWPPRKRQGIQQHKQPGFARAHKGLFCLLQLKQFILRGTW